MAVAFEGIPGIGATLSLQVCPGTHCPAVQNWLFIPEIQWPSRGKRPFVMLRHCPTVQNWLLTPEMQWQPRGKRRVSQVWARGGQMHFAIKPAIDAMFVQRQQEQEQRKQAQAPPV